jgi:predicted secreted protein
MPGIAAFDTALLMSDMTARAIHEADIGADTFRIVGDVTTLFTSGIAFRVTGSTGNDGRWYCHGNSTLDAGDTLIHVTGDITDATADGNIYLLREIAHVTNIAGPSLGLDTVDVTAHDSANAWEEVVPTIVRSGEVTLEINYDPAEITHSNTTGLAENLIDQHLTDFEIVFPFPVIGGTTWRYSGYVTAFEPSAPYDGKISAAVTMKVTGAPVLV